MVFHVGLAHQRPDRAVSGSGIHFGARHATNFLAFPATETPVDELLPGEIQDQGRRSASQGLAQAPRHEAGQLAEPPLEELARAEFQRCRYIHHGTVA